jgi:hypothetical protein
MARDNEWERSTRRVHLVCGVVVGSLIGLRFGWAWLFGERWWAGILAIVLSAAFFGWLAYSYLDEFWHRLLNWLR